MKVMSKGARAADLRDIEKSLAEWLNESSEKPSFLALHHRAGAISLPNLENLSTTCSALHCATSCKGSMHNTGVDEIGVFAIHDPEGDYGTACAQFGSDVFATAQEVTEQALLNAGRVGEAPDLIWVSCTPGCEEVALSGIEAAVGTDVPIIGGSAADDTVSGEWTVSDGKLQAANGLVVSVLFCSQPIHFAYQNGYEPTDRSGIATRTEGRRLLEIDGQPAAEVYQEWNGGAVPSAMGAAQPSQILSEATLWPLGRKVGTLGGLPNYLLAHPSIGQTDGSLELFAEIETGEELTQMKGDRAALAARAGRVASFALRAGELNQDDVAGALMVYCGGCMLSVESHLSQVYEGVDAALDGAPFLGTFTFGEQGAMHGAGNRHGNLMISCIVFVKSDR